MGSPHEELCLAVANAAGPDDQVAAVLDVVETLIDGIHAAEYGGKETTGPVCCVECFRPWPCPTKKAVNSLKAPPPEKDTKAPIGYEAMWSYYAAMMSGQGAATVG